MKEKFDEIRAGIAAMGEDDQADKDVKSIVLAGIDVLESLVTSLDRIATAAEEQARVASIQATILENMETYQRNR